MEQFIFISLLLNSLSIALVVLVVYHSEKILNEFRPYAKDLAKMRKDLQLEADSIISQAKNLAEQIVRNATVGAEKNVEVSSSVLKKLEESLPEQLQKNISDNREIVQTMTTKSLEDYQTMTSQSLQAYQKQLESLASELAVNNKEIKTKIADQANVQIDQFSKSIQEQILEIRKATEQKIETRLAEAETEVSKIRDQKVKYVDDHIYQILSDIAKKTMGKSLDMTTHEQLVLEALEKAKKEKII